MGGVSNPSMGIREAMVPYGLLLSVSMLRGVIGGWWKGVKGLMLLLLLIVCLSGGVLGV